MEDFQQKRRLIEQGQLTSWKRRGGGAFTVERVPFHRTLLQTVFRVRGCAPAVSAMPVMPWSERALHV